MFSSRSLLLYSTNSAQKSGLFITFPSLHASPSPRVPASHVPESSRPTSRVQLSVGTLSKPRRRRQRGPGKTKDLIGRTIVQHVRFKTLYISQPSYAKQQREIPTICVVSEPKPRRQIFVISIWSSTLLLYVMLKLRSGDV